MKIKQLSVLVVLFQNLIPMTKKNYLHIGFKKITCKCLSYFLLLFILLALPLISNAQVLHWAENVGGSSAEIANAIAIDAAGNVYTTGSFRGTVDFDPGAGTYNLTATGSGSGSGNDADFFVLKVDNNGNFVWAINAGDPSGDFATGFGIAVDGAGNVYVNGQFANSVDFDPGAGSTILTSAGMNDIFVLKLDNNGNLVWAKSMGGSDIDFGTGIALDAAGNVFTTGGFTNSVDFDPDASSFTLTAAGDLDIFISKLDNNGSFVWAVAMGGVQSELGTAIVIDASQFVNVTGSFLGAADFDPGPATDNFTSAGGTDIFLTVLDNYGVYYFTKTFGGPGSDDSYGLALDSSFNTYLTGNFQDTVDFDPGAGVANLTGVDGFDIFICKLDLSGNYVWAKSFTGLGEQAGYFIALDAQDNVYTTGYYQGTVDFDPGAATFNLTSAYFDMYILRLDNAGNFVYAKSTGGAIGSQAIGCGLAVDATGTTYVAGYFEGAIDFNPDAAVNNLTSNGNADIYILKYGPCTNSFSSINVSGCQSYTFNGITYSASGSYSQTFTNVLGCDSIITLNITITQPNIAVQQNGPSLMAVATGVFYQWIDCNNGNAVINGAINQTYNATVNGSYAVIITQGNCSDTSACYTVTGVGIDDLDPAILLTVFPNPASNMLTIQTSTNIESINIYNSIGEKVMQQNTKTFSVQSLTKGVYYAVIKSNKGIGHVRFAKE